MRKFMLILSLVALAAPIAAFADASPSPAQTAQQICAKERHDNGTSWFSQTYGTNAAKSNAFGKCVSAHAKAAKNAVTNASKTCSAQQADANFATSHGGKSFDQFYGGTNGKGSSKNAFGKCVSQAVQSTVAAQVKAAKPAFKACLTARKADRKAFATLYGTGRDALGKCVAAKSAPATP